jgi:phage terminase large subunit GpA-like protein
MLHDIEAATVANAAIVLKSAAAALRPDPQEKVWEWAAEYRVVPHSVSVKGGKWDNDFAPEFIEPMEYVTPAHPCPYAMIQKPNQSGGSATAENLVGYIMHRAPGPAMYIQTTIKSAKDWKIEKLDPMIEETDVLNPEKGGVVEPKTSRNGKGSKSDRLVFKGGFLLLAGANSAASLRGHSIRYMIRDDRAGWAENAEGEGDPAVLSERRLKTYRQARKSKCLDISTPLVEGDAWDRDFQKTDRRRYYMACLGCGVLVDWDWEDIKKNPKPPYRCHLDCPACGRIHYHADKPAMKSPANGACWIPSAPGPEGEIPPKAIAREQADIWRHRHTGRAVPGWELTGVINRFDSWDLIAEKEADAGEDPLTRKPFENLDLGRSHKIKGNAPEWEVLAARKEAWERGVIQPGVLYITLAVDVQGDGLYWERVGWGPNKESWTIDYGYCAGVTDVPREGAWTKLDQIAEHGALYLGIRLRDDLIVVDGNYNAEAVYAWVRLRHNAIAINGEAGWAKPAIFRAEKPDIKLSGLAKGRPKRMGVVVWHVGTYGLKAALMVYFGRAAKDGKDGRLPNGYCHFPGDAEEAYFRQLVSEYVAIEQGKSGPERRWKERGPNHWLDCRVYGFAGTHYANLWGWDEARWAARAAELAELIKTAPRDLFDVAPPAAVLAPPMTVDADGADLDGQPTGVPAEAVAIARRPRVKDMGLSALAKLNG